ncbi:Pentatricopeptide repeat-containing protein [Cynara cardunculus var. scolymus]|uniref:Pentatricopeptide repeat-containing protein n=1 Tax=Cynara cardunculus var. scolymus TaxID=59895 RepID=A0A118K1D1_CYNCS|nr:Pentatricopeptide repeat-containing protein [Cynara cardunculus var. scolymus]
MPQRTIVSYNALIAAYSRDRNSTHMAFRLLTQLNLEGFIPNGPTFTSLLQASSALGKLGSALHSQIVKFEFLSDTLVQTALLGMYSDCGDLESSKKVFGFMVQKDAMAWNSIIVGHMKNDKIMEGLRFFRAMVKAQDFPTQFTYSVVLNACSKLLNLEIGQLVHAQVIVSGIPSDLPLRNALLNMYCSCGDPKTAARVFREIENPDLVSWNSMLAGLLGNGDGEESMVMFIDICKVSFVKPDDYTFATIISATRALAARSYGKPLHGQVTKTGYEMNVYVGSTLVSMYFDNGDSESAQKLLNSMPVKDVVFWTEMITGYARMGDGENAIKCFHEMSKEHKIDSFALSIALSACADLAAHNQGEMIHSQAIKLGYDLEMTVSGSLIDMYAKSGDLRSSESVLSQIGTPDLKCWNSILGGYGHHGKGDEAFRILDEILNQGLIPDEITYLSMLAACNHCGWVEKGRFLWSSMKRNGLIPRSKHYSCFIGLLSRAGFLEEAEEMIMDSGDSGESNLELWRTLLSSCLDRRNIEVGTRVADRIMNINEEDGAAFVLVTNLYALTGRWNDVAEMRRKIRVLGEKDAGLSWIELSSNTYVFSSGDKNHPEIDAMQEELSSLQKNLAKSEEDNCRPATDDI